MKLFYTSLFIIICAEDVPSSINRISPILYNAISEDKNLIFSPFSVHYSALSLLYEGSGGLTTATIRNALFLPDVEPTAYEYKTIMDTLNSAKNVTLRIANKIYLQSGYKLKRSFRLVTENYFDADAETIDFGQSVAAAEKINEWVKEKTHNKIDKMFKPDDLDSDTRAVLLNAIYFKGKWSLPFPKDVTRTAKFYTSDTEFIMHPMMYQAAYFDYGEFVELDARILRIKYENKRFAMTIILPNSRTGIAVLEKKLSHINLNTLKLAQSKGKVWLSLPKFKIESTFNLEDPLIEIGLQNIFTNSANLSNMIEGPSNLFIQRVIQKAFIEVNEEGAEAAASTAIQAVGISASINTLVFNADHPFMFYWDIGVNKYTCFQCRSSFYVLYI
ncbi:Serpin (serine protease inhibitor) [Popillia japonica]|uniref:Serpin (Serine protease inhibitor) n=1 Tax=Popillia japonica TaxID=7064 RepID=A0AAW1LCQ4_POPJA